MTYIKKDAQPAVRNNHRSTSPTLLFLAFGIMILTCIGIGVISIMQSNQAHRDLEAIIDKIGIKLDLLKIMHANARERSINLYMMVTETDPFERDNIYMQFNRHATEFSLAYNKLKAMDLSTQEQSLLEQQAAAAN